MKSGKLTPSELQECIISKVTKRRKEVIKSVALGCDSAEIKAEGILLFTVDPITGASKNSGALAVNVCCNDIAAAGGEPVAILLSVLLPPESSTEQLRQVMTEAEKEAEKLNVEIIGGHTEFTDAVRRTVISATAIGVRPEELRFCRAEAGDGIVVSKELGLEGTAVLAADFSGELQLTEEEENEASACLNDISVVEEGKVFGKVRIAAAHDITEGGIFGAVCETAGGLGLGAEIEAGEIPFRRITEELCRKADLDKFRLLSSGSMLFVTPEPEKLIAELNEMKINAVQIGKMTEGKDVYAVIDGERRKISVQKDEIMKMYDRGKRDEKHDGIR